jgi:hypothetical protein
MPQLDKYIVFFNVIWIVGTFLIIYAFIVFFILPQLFLNLALRQKKLLIIKSKLNYINKNENIVEDLKLNLFFKKVLNKYALIYLKSNFLMQEKIFFNLQLNNIFDMPNFIIFNNLINNNKYFDEIFYYILKKNNIKLNKNFKLYYNPIFKLSSFLNKKIYICYSK